jgi:hypothetical protein
VEGAKGGQLSNSKAPNITDYSRGLYGEQLPLSGVGTTRALLKISESACKDWGSTKCATCPLQDWAGSRTPWCGAEDCEICAEREWCACGSPRLRQKLWRAISRWEADRLSARLSSGREVSMNLPAAVRV